MSAFMADPAARRGLREPTPKEVETFLVAWCDMNLPKTWAEPGPPTDDEMSAVQTVLSWLRRKAGVPA